MKLRSICLVLILSASAFIGTPSSGALDFPQAVQWGPASEADTLLVELRNARWQENEEVFQDLKNSFWKRFPHHFAVLAEVVRWNRDHQTLPDMLDALARESAETFTGLDGLTQEDKLLLEGYGLICAGYRTSGRVAIERVLSTQPMNPLALSVLYWSYSEPGPREEIVQKAFSDPEAAPFFAAILLTENPEDPLFDFREDARAMIAGQEPRSSIEVLAACEAVLDQIRQPGLTATRLAEIMDGFHSEYPAGFNGFLAPMVGSAMVWLSPESILELIRERSDWISPRKLALNIAWQQLASDLGYESYQTLNPVEMGSGQIPDTYILRSAVDWHPNAAEVEKWARYAIRDNLPRPGDDAENILKDRGHPAGADSLRQTFEYENPNAYHRYRIMETAVNDPTAGRALLDSLVSVMGERPFGWELLVFSEKSGDTNYLDECLARYGTFWTIKYLRGAIAGAQDRADLDRLVQLYELILRYAPENTSLLNHMARSFLALGELGYVNTIIDEITKIHPSSSSLFILRIDTAVKAKEYEDARNLITQLLDDENAHLDNIILVPIFSEHAGWSDLADRSLAMVEDMAPEGCLRVELVRAEMSRMRGDLDEARVMLLQLQGEWPGSDSIRRALVETGGIVEVYQDPVINLVDTSLAGLEFDYSSTDWILAGLSQPDEFSDQEFLVLRNRTTYCLWSHTQLVTRNRITIEILSDPSAAQLETMRIPYNADGAMPKILCARTITGEGSVREVPKSEILVTAHQGDEANVSDMRDLVIPFAGLKGGMVLDLCYQTTRSAFLDLGHAWVHQFGHLSPQREETVDFIVVDGVEHLLYSENQPIKSEIRDLHGAKLHQFQLEDQPAPNVEEMVEVNSLFPYWVGCTTYDSWDQLAEYYGKVFWEKAKGDEETRELVDRLVAGKDDERDRAQAIFSYIQNEVDNIGIQLGPGRLIPTSSDEVIARGYGDCKDKVAALTAMSAEVDLKCLPVLVGTRPSFDVEDDFPSSAGFNHLIAFFPDLDGGTFADPTLGAGCLEDVPEEVAGQKGLLIHPDGRGELVQIPELPNISPRVEMEVDLYPEEGGDLRAEVSAVIHFGAGIYLSRVLDSPDTNLVHAFVNWALGNQLKDDLVVVEWDKRDIGCGSLGINAVLRDTMWSSPENNDANLTWVAATDFEVELPSEKERAYPFAIDAAKQFQVVIRAHEGGGLRISSRYSPIKESGPGFLGEIQVKEGREDGKRWLEIRRDLDFTKRVYSPDDYKKLRDKYFSFRLACLQPIKYYRQSDEARMEQMRSYCRENPEDLAFSFQAARQVLGGDVGGDGEVGVERRILARELLAPALGHPDAGGMPFFMAATIAVKDNKYLEADSLLTEGLERSPRDPYLLSYADFVCMELGQDDRRGEYLRKFKNITGSEWTSYSLISHYLTVGDDENARKEEDRLNIISAAVDSVQLIQDKITGYMNSNRIELALELAPIVEGQLGQDQYFYILANIAARERRWDEAIDKLAPTHSEYPLSSMLNNKMAWYLACAGRDLDRAEYLVRMAIALDGHSAPIDNTLAVVLMRQGKRKEAKDVFASLMLDDRPSHRVTNGYFYGLCRWMEGDEQEALECWRNIENLIPGNRDNFSMLVKESLEAVDRGDDPAWIYLRPLEED